MRARTIFMASLLLCDAAAAESLRGWKFEPTRVNKAPIYKAEQVMVVIK